MKKLLIFSFFLFISLLASAQSITIHHKDGKFHLPIQKVDSISFDMKYRDSMDTTLLHKYITVNDTTINQVILNDTLWKKITMTDTIYTHQYVTLHDTIHTYFVDSIYTHSDTIHTYFVDSIYTHSDTIPQADHQYVDLGLSVKWATCNVGATNPEDYGDYFTWGETATKTYYSSISFFDSSYTKYNTEGGKTTLDLEDDAAYVNWGSDWRMPTKAEQDELRTKCTWSWITLHGVNGYNVTGTNGNFIFLPAAGCRLYTSLYDEDVNGFYWSSSIDSYFMSDAFCLSFSSSNEWWNNLDRSGGHTIRPVCP